MENKLSLQILYEECEENRCLSMMRELEQWIKSVEEANAVMRDFSKYQVCEYPKELVKEKEKILDEVQKKEDDCKHSLAMEIGFSVSIDEFRELNLSRPGQVIGWAIKQGVSENPNRRARWAWFRDVEDVLIHWAGPNDIRLRPNPERDAQIERMKTFRRYFPV